MVPKDINGEDVFVGSKVKVLSIDKGLLSTIPKDEIADVMSMVGEIFEVYEVSGEYASVEKWWSRGDGCSESHSIALAKHEMELMDNGSS